MLTLLQVTGISFFVMVVARRRVVEDPVVPLMCSEKGSLFWTALIRCSSNLTPQGLEALKFCVPHSNPRVSERTRLSVCSDRTKWSRMMNCMSDFKKRQNAKDVNLELSPGPEYRKCVGKLVETSSKRKKVLEEK